MLCKRSVFTAFCQVQINSEYTECFLGVLATINITFFLSSGVDQIQKVKSHYSHVNFKSISVCT